MKTKNVLVVSDFHCGWYAGFSVGKPVHKWFFKKLKEIGHIDICVHNGDLIEGKGPCSGGTEIEQADRVKQILQATDLLREIRADQYFLTYGTPYHTGREEDWEDLAAHDLNCPIKSQLFLDVNGLIFHFKHHISNSTIPHGRYTMLARQKVWNLFWREISETPNADIFVRSHRHGLDYCGGDGWLALTTPSLGGLGSKIGERLIERTITMGFILFRVASKGDWNWEAFIYRPLMPNILIKA